MRCGQADVSSSRHLNDGGRRGEARYRRRPVRPELHYRGCVAQPPHDRSAHPVALGIGMTGLVRLGNALGTLGLALILLIAFGFQFGRNELPCPLCLLQRLAFVLCGFGFLLNLRFGSQPAHYGLTLLAALFGLAAAGRHLLLHIVPGTGTYGSALLGLPSYSL